MNNFGKQERYVVTAKMNGGRLEITTQLVSGYNLDYWDRLKKLREEYERNKIHTFSSSGGMVVIDYRGDAWIAGFDPGKAEPEREYCDCAVCEQNDPIIFEETRGTEVTKTDKLKSNFDELENTAWKSQSLAETRPIPADWFEDAFDFSMSFDNEEDLNAFLSHDKNKLQTDDELKTAVYFLSKLTGLSADAIRDDIRSFRTGRLRNCQLAEMLKLNQWEVLFHSL